MSLAPTPTKPFMEKVETYFKAHKSTVIIVTVAILALIVACLLLSHPKTNKDAAAH